MTQKPKKIPDWDDVLDAFEKIQTDPELSASVKDIILLFLIRIRVSGNRLESMKCLKKYGAVPVIRTKRYYDNPIWEDSRKRSAGYSGKLQTERMRTTEDFRESIALAHALDLLSRHTGNNAEVLAFLYKLKVRFWHIGADSGCCIHAIFNHGKQMYRCFAVWYMITHRATLSIRERKKESQNNGVYSFREPPELFSFLQKIPTLPEYRNCHTSILSGKLNLFVLYAMSSKRTLSKDDFWGIIANNRMDFLEYLLLDFPDKKLPCPLREMILIALFTIPDYQETEKLKMLRLIEQVSPGVISAFSDSNGGNLLWYSIFISKEKPSVNENGALVLTPVQRFLYDLCDHAKPNCDGISFDDLCRYFPLKLLK